MSLRDLVAIAAGGLMLIAPSTARAFPWSIDMFRGAPVQPFAIAPRNMPEGTLPVQGDAPPLDRSIAAATLANPLSPSPAHLRSGESLFGTYCVVCHGRDGKGNGPVAFQMIIPPPDITMAQPAERSDGYLYATIRAGSIVMPAYSDSMSSQERWQVVLYLRQLQAKAALP